MFTDISNMCWHHSCVAFLCIYFTHIHIPFLDPILPIFFVVILQYLCNGLPVVLSVLTLITSIVMILLFVLYLIFLITLRQMLFFSLPDMWWYLVGQKLIYLPLGFNILNIHLLVLHKELYAVFHTNLHALHQEWPLLLTCSNFLAMCIFWFFTLLIFYNIQYICTLSYFVPKLFPSGAINIYHIWSLLSKYVLLYYKWWCLSSSVYCRIKSAMYSFNFSYTSVFALSAVRLW